ncbi:MAG: sugar phosphate isomerase/epimerase [Fimbriimonadaceae bacterium]|nr:sugar phosphate isomerase/epimerase [Fimbriimonadaceae bacterium]
MMRLGLQLYTLREALANDLDGTLASIAGMGVAHVELAGTYGFPASEFRGRLDAHGLTTCGSHVSLPDLVDRLDSVVQEAQVLGVSTLVLPWIGEEAYQNGWDALGRSLTAIGHRLHAQGLAFAYHNHAFELAPANGETGLERLFATADPAVVKAELDLGWIQHAGQDPADWVRSLAGRVPLVHLKDFAAGTDPIDVPPGEGTVDWDSVLDACNESGVEFGIVEMDHPPGDAIASVRTSVAFFRNRGLI